MEHAGSKLERRATCWMPLVVLGLCLAVTRQASASEGEDCRARSCWLAGVGGDFATALDTEGIGAGGGVDLAAGLQRNLGKVALISELVLSHHVLHADGGDDPSLSAIKLGGRLRFLEDIEPGLFLHMGGGRRAGGSGPASIDFALDGGLSLDFTMLPVIDFGLHAAINRIFGGEGGGVTYATLGVHAALVIKDEL